MVCRGEAELLDEETDLSVIGQAGRRPSRTTCPELLTKLSMQRRTQAAILSTELRDQEHHPSGYAEQ